MRWLSWTIHDHEALIWYELYSLDYGDNNVDKFWNILRNSDLSWPLKVGYFYVSF